MNFKTTIPNGYVNNINANGNQEVSNFDVIMGNNKKSPLNSFSSEIAKIEIVFFPQSMESIIAK